MKTMIIQALEHMLYDATVAVIEATTSFDEARRKFFDEYVDADTFREAKKELDKAVDRLSELETAQKVIDEIVKKGVEV